MREIIGNTTTTPMAVPDWEQTDEKKADYIKNKPKVLTEEDVIQLIEENGGDAGVQSDWNQTDEKQLDYIKNKPILGALSSKDTLSKTDVGLDQVDNTADIDKPVSTAQQAALDTKVNKSGDTVSGVLSIDGQLVIPNSPTTPDEAKVTDSYTERETANKSTTWLTVVDGSETLVNKIEGDTVKTTNLCPFPYYDGMSKTYNGVTWTVNSDGSVTANGTATSGNSVYYFIYNSQKITYEPNEYYWYRACPAGGSTDTYWAYLSMMDETGAWKNDAGNEIGNGSYWIKDTAYFIRFQANIKEGYTANNLVFKPIYGYGREVKEYVPYFEGLKHAYIKAIKSTGRNLIDYTKIYTGKGVGGSNYSMSGDEISIRNTVYQSGRCFSDPVLLPAGTYTISAEVKSTSNYYTFYGMGVYKIDPSISSPVSSDYVQIAAMRVATITSAYTRIYRSFTITESGYYSFNMQMKGDASNTYVGLTFRNLQIAVGNNTIYEPYTEHLFELPETLELKKWDSLNPQTGELTNGNARTEFDGSEDWLMELTETTIGGTGYRIGIHLSDFKVTAGSNIEDEDIIVNMYNIITAAETWLGKKIGASSGGKDIMYLYDPKYCATSDISLWKAHLAELYAAGTPLIVEYKKATPTIKKLENMPKSYTVYDGGTEIIIQGETDNSIYGAMPTIEQTYVIHENPTEAANKAYVNNGLAKKLDKTGGTITGNLIVEGKTDAELGAIISKQGDVTYGLAYENETYKLGQGTVDEKNNFTFNENEGLPIALRDDSSEFTDGHLVKWSADGNKLSSTNLNEETLATKEWVQNNVKGDTGAKIVSTVLQGQDANGGNVYLQTFDDGSTATFTAPKGERGDFTTDDRRNTISWIKNKIDIVPRDVSAWEQGSIISTGINSDTSISIRTAGGISVKYGETYSVKFTDSTYKVSVIMYDTDGTFTRYINYRGDTVIFGDMTFTVNRGESVARIVFGHVDNSTITPSEIENIGITIVNEQVEHISLTNSYKKAISLMTFNVGQYYDGATSCPNDYVDTQKNVYKQIIEKYHPDFIFTQEAPEFCNVGGTILGRTFFDDYYSINVGMHNTSGKQFITNHDIFDYKFVSFSNEREYIKAYTYINGIKIALYNTHLSYTSANIRAVQINELIADMQTEEYVILAGDLNVASADELIPFTNAGYRLGNCGSFGSFMTAAPNQFVDNIIVSSNITLCKAFMEDKLYESMNDHRPFILTVEVGANAVDEPADSGVYTEYLTINNGIKTRAWRIMEDSLSQVSYNKPSKNLYDASLQTPETISPHYYVDGAPYSSTQFDDRYNCTALIEVEPNTQYTIGLVEGYADTSIPWGSASSGAFFYDENEIYISGSSTKTFTTPARTKYMRFNYAIVSGVTLAMLNSSCMLVKGDTLPTKYEPYTPQITLEEKIADIEAAANPALYYKITGEEIVVVTKYGAAKDFAVTLKRKGGNNLFDFYKFGTIANDTSKVSRNIDGQTVLLTTTGDWIAPFKIKAVSNIDGDQIDKNYFTGGNHQYNNSGDGSTATARSGGVRFFADGREVSDTSGYANNLEIRTTNYIQANNTTKADGSGREVLQQDIRFKFDGVKWEIEYELIPLEDINLICWYGLQCFTDLYGSIKYVGANNRSVYDVNGAKSCGDLTTSEMILFGDEHELSVSIDSSVDMGKAEFATGSDTMRCFISGDKAYFTIYNGTAKTLTQDSHYYLRGAYRFTAR